MLATMISRDHVVLGRKGILPLSRIPPKVLISRDIDFWPRWDLDVYRTSLLEWKYLYSWCFRSIRMPYGWSSPSVTTETVTYRLVLDGAPKAVHIRSPQPIPWLGESQSSQEQQEHFLQEYIPLSLTQNEYFLQRFVRVSLCPQARRPADD